VRVYALRPEAVAALTASSVGSPPPISRPAVVPRLSIVVLPFANLSNDPEQQYFADGITEDLTTDLSRIADMFVISRNTAFTYKDRRVDTKQIGRDLGVRYMLEGSIRRSGNQIRVNAQLIDAATDAHLWALVDANDRRSGLHDGRIGRVVRRPPNSTVAGGPRVRILFPPARSGANLTFGGGSATGTCADRRARPHGLAAGIWLQLACLGGGGYRPLQARDR